MVDASLLEGSVPSGGWVDLAAAAFLALLLAPMAFTQRRISRAEGALLLACYAAYTLWQVQR